MISRNIRKLTVENPMVIEITRFRRRFFSFSTGNSMNSVVLTLILIGYAILVLVILENASSIAPIMVIEMQTAILTLLAPMMLYGSIASERERRSWDLLMVAPITKAQVVAGKFIGAMAALGIACGMFLVPILISAAQYDARDYYGTFSTFGTASRAGRTVGSEMFLAELCSLTFLMFVCALTILFSARAKRSLMALGTTLGTLAIFLIVIPAFLETTGGTDHLMTDVSLYFYPFYVLARLLQVEQRGFIGASEQLPILWGWLQSFTYFGLAVTLLGWASNTLHFAENEVKFLPQGEKNA